MDPFSVNKGVDLFLSVMIGVDLGWLTELPWYISSALKIGVIIVIAVVVERIAARYIRGFVKRVE